MTDIGILATDVLDGLQASAQLSDISFVLAYENDIKPTPLDKPIVAISVKKSEIGDFIKEVSDDGKISTTLSRPVKTTLSVDIYAPYSMGGEEIYKIFDRISQKTLFMGRPIATSATCGEADYDKSCQAIILRTQLVIEQVSSAAD